MNPIEVFAIGGLSGALAAIAMVAVGGVRLLSYFDNEIQGLRLQIIAIRSQLNHEEL